VSSRIAAATWPMSLIKIIFRAMSFGSGSFSTIVPSSRLGAAAAASTRAVPTRTSSSTSSTLFASGVMK
jgi:hypothetical protein